MTATREVRLLTVVADTAIEQELLADFLELGAKGYTCSYCFGKGRHEPMEDPYTGRSRVRIEIVAEPDVAKRCLDHAQGEQFARHAVIAFLLPATIHQRASFL